ncbi:MAG: Dps family protein [Fluviicola sp.]|jgi:starvation-inducible DNA-binding protein
MSSQKDLSTKMNRLLATYQVHYQNLRAIHWNIKGNNFFELHLKYEELYTRTQVIIDDLAERILTLGITPLHTFEDYLKNSKLKENKTIHDGKEGMTYILKAQETILKLEREILKESADLDDDGTNSMISDLVREKEKTNWMFAAWLGK